MASSLHGSKEHNTSIVGDTTLICAKEPAVLSTNNFALSMQMSTQQKKKKKKVHNIDYENNFDLTDQGSVDQSLRNAIIEHILFFYSENRVQW